MYTIISEPIMPITLDKIEELNKNLEKRFRDKLVVNHDLKRTLVSFQANKKNARLSLV